MNSPETSLNPTMLRVIKRLGTEASLRFPESLNEFLAGQDIEIHMNYGSGLAIAAQLISQEDLARAIELGLCCAIYGSPDHAGVNQMALNHIKIFAHGPDDTPTAVQVITKQHQDKIRSEIGRKLSEFLLVIANDSISIALEELGVREPPAASDLPGLVPFTENGKRYLPLR